MIFANAIAITIPEGSVKRILSGDNVLWEIPLFAYENLLYKLSGDGSHYICVGVKDNVSGNEFTVADTVNGLPVADVAVDAFTGLTKPTVHINSDVNLDNAPWGATNIVLYINGIQYRQTTTSSRKPQYVCDVTNADFKGGVVEILGRIGSIIVSELDSGAFSGKTNITEVIIPAEMKWIEASVFKNCTNLTKVIIKGTISTFTASAFSGCTNLTDIYVPWAEGAVANAPWGATNATIHYNVTYTPIEYIETSGTQYIDTGFNPNQNTRVVIDFTALPHDSENSVFGCRSTSSSRVFAFSVRNTGTWRFGYGSEYTGSVKADTERHTVDANMNVISMDGTVLYTADSAEFTTAYTMAIGAVKTSAVRYGYVRIYSCQVYDNGTLIRDLVPCINSDGEAGMWDKLNGVFYGNAGSGEFITST